MKPFLSQILEHRINIEDLKRWFANPQDATEDIRSHGCEPTDFAFFLLAYLRDEVSSLISNNDVTPMKERNGDISMKSSNQQTYSKASTKKFPTRLTNPNIKRATPITLGNFITSKSVQKNKRNKAQNESIRLDSPSKRRIDLTMVSSSSSGTSDLFNVTEQVDHNQERLLLENEKLRISNDVICDISQLSLQHPILHKKDLDTLSKIYNLILEFELALNIMTELYFLIELLTIDTNLIQENEYFKNFSNNSRIFGSFKNCAYFASKTLHRQQKLLQYLDTSSIRLLIENKYLKEFSPELITHLKSLKPQIRRSLSVDSSVISYQTDTYDRQSFSSPDIFQLFRKQRDFFYSILESWDTERYFTPTLITKINVIFKQIPNPEFYMHFSNLFVAQLIASCIGVLTSEKKNTDFPDLQVDPVRLQRLHERLVNPARTSGSPCPFPEFSAWEEFYRDFIQIAGNHRFNLHLRNSFITKIIELNSQQFMSSELQDSDTYVEEDTINKFVICALSLQLLAKFLGWLSFNPYMPSRLKSLPEHVIALQAAERLEVNPSLDACGILTSAETQGRLVLAVPWLCSYVAQLDPVSLRLPHYTHLLRRLLALQRTLPYMRKTSQATRVLLKFCLGWSLGILVENNPGIWDMARLNLVCHQIEECKTGSLDSLDLVDSQVLVSLCPFLSELRSRLSSGGVMAARSCTGPRHITPVTALNSQNQLELQLESSFLQTLPSYVRRTIDFVAERVSYSCTKHLVSGILTHQTLILRKEVQKIIVSEANKHQNLREDFSKFVAAVSEGLSKWTSDRAEKYYREIQSVCKTEVQQFCSAHCTAALNHLLTQCPLSSHAIAGITSRNAANKVYSWMQVRCSVGELQKQISEEVDRHARAECKVATPKSDPRYSNVLPTGGRPVNHDERVLCSADTLVLLRELMLHLMKGEEVDRSYVKMVLNHMETCVINRADMIPSALNYIQELSLDLMFTLVCRQPELMDAVLLSKIISLWTGPVGRPVTIDRLLCVRNMKHMSKVKDDKSWTVLTLLLVSCVNAHLLTPASLEQQVIAALQQEWSQNFLSHYMSFIETVVKEVSKNLHPSEAGTFRQLLEWVADYCRDLDQDLF